MSIHQHKDGRYYVAYREPGNPSVKNKYFGRGAQGKQLALAWELERMKSPETAIKTPAKELTFAELVEKYLALHPLAEGTRRTFVYNLNLNVLPLFGNTLVSALTLANLAALDSRLAQPSPKTGKPVSVSTRNRYKAMCRAICQWGYDQGLTAANPFDRVKLDRKKEGLAPDLITDAEIAAIFKQAPPHLQWAITCMLNLGVRPGESELFAIKDV